ncbi:MAG: peptidoglycan-binding domain-containing protein [Chitinophagales bacterium]
MKCLATLILVLLTALSISLPLAAQGGGTTTINRLPDDAGGDKCYAKATTTERYEMVENKRLLKAAYTKVVEHPAVFDTIVEKVLIQEESIELVVIPAKFETKEERVLVQEAYPTVVEAYENVVNTVEVQPAGGTWQKTTIDPNCTSPNPEDCIIMTYEEKPAILDTVTKKVLKEVKNNSKENPPEYKIVKKKVLKKPAEVIQVTNPAQYEQVVKRVLVKPSRREEIEVPAEYEMVMEKKKVEAGGLIKWVEIVCPKKINSSVIKQLQLALNLKGYYDGQLDGVMGTQTKQALSLYQQSTQLPTGNLNAATMQSLGLSF